MNFVVDFHKPLAIAAYFVIFAGVVYTLVSVVWFIVFGYTLTSVVYDLLLGRESVPDTPSAVSQVTTRHSVSVEGIAAMHLFGTPTSSGEVARERTESLQETRLSLKLVGVFVADDAQASAALVARRGQLAERYRIGERLPGNATLAEVYRDRVVISRDGVRELIRFEPRQGQEFVPSVASLLEGGAMGSIRRMAEPMAEPMAQIEIDDTLSRIEPLVSYQDELATDPVKLLATLGLAEAPADDGGGYVIGAVADRPELKATGLQRGDRIISVNGQAVGDPESDRLELQKVVALGEVSIEIQRGERRFFWKLPIN